VIGQSKFWAELYEWAQGLPQTLKATKAPTDFHWKLRGATAAVLQDFRFHAESTAPILCVPVGCVLVGCVLVGEDATDALLDRLAQGPQVQSPEVRRRLPSTRGRLTARSRSRRSIAPLREALMDYCTVQMNQGARPLSAGSQHVVDLGKKAFSQAHVEKNREQKARDEIVGALQRLKVAVGQWPEYVQEHLRQPDPRFNHPIAPSPFQPPVFDRLNQSPADWQKAADQAWQKHRESFLKGCEFWTESDVDAAISTDKRTRGTGKKRRNALPSLRFEWAARKIAGCAWKEIACARFTESQVTKAATAILNTAGWPTKEKKNRKSGSKTPVLSTARKATKRK